MNKEGFQKSEKNSKMNLLEVNIDSKQMPYVELHNPTPEIRRKILAVMTNRDSMSEAYKLKTDAGAFVQSDDADYLLLEFWKPEHQAFVDYLNKILNE